MEEKHIRFVSVESRNRLGFCLNIIFFICQFWLLCLLFFGGELGYFDFLEDFISVAYYDMEARGANGEFTDLIYHLFICYVFFYSFFRIKNNYWDVFIGGLSFLVIIFPMFTDFLFGTPYFFSTWILTLYILVFKYCPEMINNLLPIFKFSSKVSFRNMFGQMLANLKLTIFNQFPFNVLATLVILDYLLQYIPANLLGETLKPLFVLVLFIVVHNFVFIIFILASQFFLLSGEFVKKYDKRRPILYLRTFNNDRYSHLRESNIFIGMSGEELISKVVSKIGPFIGICDPNDFRDSYGSAKTLCDDDDWQDCVMDYVNDSKYIVLHIGKSDAVYFELDLIDHLERQNDVLILLSSSLVSQPIFPQGLSLTDTQIKKKAKQLFPDQRIIGLYENENEVVFICAEISLSRLFEYRTKNKNMPRLPVKQTSYLSAFQLFLEDKLK